MTALIFWFFFSQSEISVATTEMVKKKLLNTLNKQNPSVCEHSLSEREKNVFNTYFSEFITQLYKFLWKY